MEGKTVIRKLEKIIQSYIPKNTRCRFDEAKREHLREKEKNVILPYVKEKVERMDSPLEIKITEDWQKIPPDMSVCRACKEVIYGVQYELSILVCGDKVPQEKRVRLCETCYLKKDT